MKTVIYHSADYDGIFCREIAKKFLEEKEVNYIGWNFGDPPIHLPINGEFVVMDLPIDRIFGIKFTNGCVEWPNGDTQPLDRVDWGKFTWIDHHKSSIESHPTSIPGYRIDGVAACRLAWQWFTAEQRLRDQGSKDARWIEQYPFPQKQDFIDRKVCEPFAVRLAGEYDVWDKRDPKAEILQYGLRSAPLTPAGWNGLLANDEILVNRLLEDGAVCQRYVQSVDSGHMHASFIREWEGLKFLCLNGRGNSNTFASRDRAETGHDALLLFYFTGEAWLVSLYHAKHRTDLDLSTIAVKQGGGGHKGACGFTCKALPFPVVGQ